LGRARFAVPGRLPEAVENAVDRLAVVVAGRRGLARLEVNIGVILTLLGLGCSLAAAVWLMIGSKPESAGEQQYNITDPRLVAYISSQRWIALLIAVGTILQGIGLLIA
jgi:hypothetical protein